jgi:glycerol-3-phosphate dehydrogenase
MYTIYGGKLTAYRALAEEVASKIVKAFGDNTPSQTHLSKFWAKPESLPKEFNLPERFNNI